MSIRTIRSRLVAGSLLAAAGLAAAQDLPTAPEAAPEAPVRRYRVEFILFAHNEFDPAEEVFGNEGLTAGSPAFGQPLFVPPPRTGPGGGPRAAPQTPSAGGDSLELIDPFGRLAGGSADAAPAPLRFRVLRDDELQLGDEFARIQRLGAYRALAHGGWVQEALDEAGAQPMSLANLGIVNPTGTLQLHLSRFLHLSVDLEYQSNPPAAGAGGDVAPGLAELQLRPRYRMLEQRRVTRSGELHYVDHPMFGLLFLISPAPEENAPAEDDTAVLTPAA